jgi:hypothetical protein
MQLCCILGGKKKRQIPDRIVVREERTEAIVNIHECIVLYWVQ